MRSEVSFRAVWSENYNRGKSPDAVVGQKMKIQSLENHKYEQLGETTKYSLEVINF